MCNIARHYGHEEIRNQAVERGCGHWEQTDGRKIFYWNHKKDLTLN